jgi:hypothetical protein
MCRGFSTCVTSEFHVYLTLPDGNKDIHHQDIISEFNLEEPQSIDALLDRTMIRTENPNWDKFFVIDEDHLPDWAVKNKALIQERVEIALNLTKDALLNFAQMRQNLSEIYWSTSMPYSKKDKYLAELKTNTLMHIGRFATPPDWLHIQ